MKPIVEGIFPDTQTAKQALRNSTGVLSGNAPLLAHQLGKPGPSSTTLLDPVPDISDPIEEFPSHKRKRRFRSDDQPKESALQQSPDQLDSSEVMAEVPARKKRKLASVSHQPPARNPPDHPHSKHPFTTNPDGQSSPAAVGSKSDHPERIPQPLCTTKESYAQTSQTENASKHTETVQLKALLQWKQQVIQTLEANNKMLRQRVRTLTSYLQSHYPDAFG